MFKFYRNILTAGIVSLGLVACGDDVTVSDPPTPPPPGVTSVTVAPGQANMVIGQNIVFAASVIADAGVSTAVTWTSSAPTIASVDATGKVTGVAAGTTTIIATSTADAGKKGVAAVTVTGLAAGIVSFGVQPTTATLAPGQFIQASAQLVTAPGQTGTVTWSSLNPTIATVNATTGQITGVATGAAVIRATATVGASTATADIGVTVRPIVAATLSIQSVTAGLLTLPVVLTNVAGQIEVNMNFNPGEQTVDSINVFIGNKRAAKAIYTTNPATGLISLSINTAEFVTTATSPTATVSYLNGQTGITAVVYPRGASSSATQATPIVLNNIDGWAGKITKPTVIANNINGITYWGGPTAAGITATQIWAVQYNGGRNGIETVTWTVGGCTPFTAGGVVGVPITTALTRTFGYVAAGAQTSCTNYENLAAGARDNIIVNVAVDGVNNGFPLTPLIANTVVFGATPDSLRIDYVAPTVSTPSLARTAPAVMGWVNAGFNFINFASTDFGVGLRGTRDRATVYNVAICPALGAQGVAMPTGTGADIPECASNFIGGAIGLGGTAPYTVNGTESDRLGNIGTSLPTATFGVDKTAPSIRQGTVDAGIPLVAVAAADAIFSAKPTAANVFRNEFLDERSGFSATAQLQALSRAGHAFNLGTCIAPSVGPIGPTFVTAPACVLATATLGALRNDGWLAGQEIPIPTGEGYYGYTSNVTDAAGNTSATLFRKVLVNANNPFATGLGVPASLTNANFAFQVTGGDSAEVINNSLALEYPNTPTTPFLRYPQVAIGITFDNVITSPFLANVAPPTGAPYVRSMETVVAGAFPTANFNPTYSAASKPVSVQAWAFNPSNFLAASPVIPVPGVNVQDGAGIAAWNAANPTVTVGHWRVISTVSTTNQFGSTQRLRAHSTAPISSSVNAPFARVDFYRLDAGGTWWNYLGSDLTGQLTDVLPNRSWLYDLTQTAAVVGPPAVPALFATTTWNGAQQTGIIAGNVIIAVGVLPNGDAISTAATTMVP